MGEIVLLIPACVAMTELVVYDWDSGDFKERLSGCRLSGGALDLLVVAGEAPREDSATRGVRERV